MLAANASFGPYKILAPIGAGGMGEVYRARDTRLGRDVAIKVIPAELSREPDRIKRFEQEARAAGALNHPNVCAIYDVGTHEGSPYVVMELLEGESLHQRLASGPVPLRKALDYAAQVAHGLSAAHEKGIVHRDLKPGNVFVTKSGRVKVLDFGLAKLTRPDVLGGSGETTASIAATETGMVLGTVGYMSPEQVRGERADHRSDLFALGAILYELLTGKRAFHGATYVETLSAILNADPAPLTATASGRGTLPAVELIVRRCLEKAPEQRFQSASDLAFDLESMSGSGSGAVAGAAAGGARLRLRRVLGIATAAFAIGALLVAVGSYQFVKQKHLVDPARVKYTQLTAQRGRINSARFAPDGTTIFYTAEWEGRLRQVFEVRRGFPERAVSLPAGALLRSISSAGMMAVGVGDFSLNCPTLAEVPITGGTPHAILGDIRAADWAPDGRTLAVSRFVGLRFRLELPPGHVIYESSASVQPLGLRVSPDGKRLALVESPTGLHSPARLVILDRTGRVTARTAEGTGSVAAWSADGREVWYTVWAGGATTELRAMSPAGRQRVVARFDGGVSLCDIGRDGQVLLARSQTREGIRGRRSPLGEERELGWYEWSEASDISADGRLLLFDEGGIYSGESGWVCLRGMDGSPPVRLGEGSAMGLSPDGKWALTLHLGPPPRLALLPMGAGESVSLPRGNIDVYYGASWMPDGKNILFTGAEAGRPRRPYAQDIKGGPPRPIGLEGIVSVLAISPDGRFIAFERDRRLYVRPIDGREERLVTQILPGEWVLQWATDGRSLYVGEGYGGGTSPSSYRVSRLDLATGTRTPWRTFSMLDPAGVGIRETFLITRDGRSYAYTYFRTLGDLYLAEGLR